MKRFLATMDFYHRCKPTAYEDGETEAYLGQFDTLEEAQRAVRKGVWEYVHAHHERWSIDWRELWRIKETSFLSDGKKYSRKTHVLTRWVNRREDIYFIANILDVESIRAERV